ncbi:TPA: dUTPase [Staphylococcus delphini]|nr:dUTPase [Staphylococcus delphini]
MAKQLIENQLQELFEIQKIFNEEEFRVRKINIDDVITNLIFNFVKWSDTLELTKSWKEERGKSSDVQLDALAEYLATNLQLVLMFLEDDKEGLETVVQTLVDLVEKEQTLPELRSGSFGHVLHTITEQFFSEEGILPLIALPFLYAYSYYTIEDLITAYKKKMRVKLIKLNKGLEPLESE